MKKISCLLLFLLFTGYSLLRGQDVSNKGKDFWLGYGYHVNMAGNPSNGGSQDMVLYFTSDKNANITVDIPGIGYQQTYTVMANQVTISLPIPKSGTQDARINTFGTFNRGIHVTSDVPIVAYAHIYNASVSGASLLFPTNTLGKDYYSINYTQSSNANNANSFFFVVATEDNTTVEITPSATNLNGLPVGQAFTVTLNTGQVYNVMGTVSGNSGSDLTGSRIKSISSNGSGGCKKIAVFSGSGKISIGGTASGTADNLFAQAFPAVAWGKKYLTAPTGSQPNNFYRICVSDPTTVVKLNGSILPVASLVNGFYYQFKNGNAAGTNPPVPNLIEADKPILVAQYCTTQGQEGNPSSSPGGDPEMIYLSPVEQTINDITLYSATKNLILQSYINVIIKKGGLASFTLDGNKISSFQPHPQDSNYYYTIVNVGSGSHRLYSDTGFNAIAYGFGNAESYGYNAGTSIRDFTPVATFQNLYNRIDSAVTCTNSPFQFSVPLRFVPTTLQWDFSAAPNISPNTKIGPLTNVTADTTKTINGILLNYYSPKTVYTFVRSNTATSRDTIKLYTTSATPDGCGSSSQVFTIPVTVRDRPASPVFGISYTGCISDSVMLTDQTPNPDGTLTSRVWDFGDGSSVILSSAQTFGKLYSVINNYLIKLKTVNDIGCASDSVVQTVKITSKPNAKFTVPAITCTGSSITFSDASSIQSGTIVKWTWDLDNGAGPVSLAANTAQVTKYDSFGVKNVKLLVESSSGCKSDTFRISPAFTVNPLPKVGFVLPEVCVSDGAATFIDTTKIADRSSFSWSWRIQPGRLTGSLPVFADAAAQNARISLNKADYYMTTLKVTSSKGCIDSLTQQLTVNGPTPKANFTVQNANGLCSNDSIRIVNTSTVDFGYLTRLDIVWDTVGSPGVKVPDENPYDQKKYAARYTDFQSPATRNYYIKLIAFSGNSSVCQNAITKIVTVNASPKVNVTTLPGICNEASPRQITQASYDTRVTGSFTYTGTGVSSSGLYSPQSVTPGSYPVTFMYTSDKGCVDTMTKRLTVWPSPVAKWGVSSPLCQKNDILFTDSSVANYRNITQRVWNYDDGTGAVTRTTGATYAKQFAAAKTYAVSLQVFTDSGCKSVVNVQALAVKYLPRPAFSLPSICLPDGKGQFTNQSAIDDGSEALFSYLWNFNDPADPSASTLKEPVHRYSALGPYPVQVKITSKDGCVDSVTKSLTTIYPQPKADFSTTPAFVCLGDTIRFKDLGNGKTSNAASWVWDLANGNSATLQNPLKKYIDSGTFTVSYYFFNAQGCVSDTAAKQVTVYPYPKLVLGPAIKVLEGGQVTIRPRFVYGRGLQYQWLPANYLSSDTAATPRCTPLEDITYQLILTADGGCSVSDTIFIQVLRSPEVPNVFSPNGDGVNDTWRIKYLESYPGAEIDVYNRYGQVVFHSVGYDKDWDGTYKDRSLPVGTYYYIINPKNGRQIIKGSVTIIK